jgi:integrase/recombinase XerD
MLFFRQIHTSHSFNLKHKSLLTKLTSKGVGVRVLAEIAGHSSITITQRYLDANDE